jgi:hypothetical protein
MKPKMTFWNGKWWCRHQSLGVAIGGNTMREAWDNMWSVYAEVSKLKPEPVNVYPRHE